MNVLKKILTLITMVFITTGCSIKPAKVVYSEPTNNKTINVYSLIEQGELDALYPIQDSSAVSAQFGLIGALVGSAIDASANSSSAETAEENLSAIRNELVDLDFDKVFEEEIVKKLKNNINVNQIRTVKSKQQLNKSIADGETYVLLNTSYKMDIDFRTPFIVTEIQIAKKSDKKQKVKAETLYKNTFTYFGHSLPVPKKDIDIDMDTQARIDLVKAEWEKLPAFKRKKPSEKAKYNKKLKKAGNGTINFDTSLSFDEANKISAQIWSTEYKEQLKVNLREGIQDLFTLISNDIKDKTDPKSYSGQGITLAGYPEHHKSIIIEENEKNKVIRFTEGIRAGSICSMRVTSNKDKLVCL